MSATPSGPRNVLRRDRFGRFARLLVRLPKFLRGTVTLEEATRTARRLLEEREENFLLTVEQTIFRNRKSPYRPLLDAARCEFGDLRESVRRDGLETTLRALRGEGVYVSFEEFRGRTPIARNGVEVRCGPDDFENPLVRGAFRSSTTGSTGPSAPIWLSLTHIAERARMMVLGYAANGLLGSPTVILRETLPGPSIAVMLEDAHIGQVHERWFAPALHEPPYSIPRNRTAMALILATDRFSGVHLPRPEAVSLERPDALLAWVKSQSEAGEGCMIRTGISHALRVAAAAEARGLDLRGATFGGAGEPATPGKVAAIERAGARWLSIYSIMEVGRVGIACGKRTDASDVHFLKHAVALVQYPRDVPESGGHVDSFHYTSLVPGAPKVLLNVETDDFGVVEERDCGCLLGELGFREHIRDIYSFRKLTGEGVSLLGTDLLRIIDEVLPSRFGGSPLDYQLIEEEEERGFTKVSVVVSPRVGPLDAQAVIDVVLREVGQSSRGAKSIWERGETLRVVRAEPRVTGRGKLRPLVPRPPTET